MKLLEKEALARKCIIFPLSPSIFYKIRWRYQRIFPEMETYYAQALTLPLYYDLNEKDVERVVASLKKALTQKA